MTEMHRTHATHQSRHNLAGTRSKTFVWHFDSPVEAIWPILSDTARFNEAAGLPKHEIEETPQPDGSVRYVGRGKVSLFNITWTEQPTNWIHEHWFEHCRHFHSGPLKFLCASLCTTPEEGGCKAEYTVEVAPANLIGRVVLSVGFFRQIEKTFTPLIHSARAYAKGERETEFDVDAKTAPGAQVRATELTEKIDATEHGHGLARRLADHVLNSPEVDVWTIRPLRLAKLWAVPERHAIEACLEAVKQGLLRLRWDILCPRCQVGKGSVLALDQLPKGAHCDSCNIDYDQDYSNNVELAFHPAKAIRPLDGGEYCLFGPMSTPHIKIQLTLAPGERREVVVSLARGRYRVRTLEAGAELSFDWQQGQFPQVIATGDEMMVGEPSTPGLVSLYNRADRPLTLILEEHLWVRDALTAKRVTAMQAFRDLFNEEVLRPGDDVEIDTITIMFTDLKGSTALYERIGDPRAYALVREHFAILGNAVRDHNGGIVKTIGDAIMAVFTNPEDGLHCAVQIHQDFEAYNATSNREPMTVKVGLHTGRCISVTLNDRLDYYGTAANKAARLQSQSVGGDIVLSPEYAQDPVVAGALGSFAPRQESAKMKGFDESIAFLRITQEDLERARQLENSRPASSLSQIRQSATVPVSHSHP